jgi:Lrp/AsnC family leucine-responsive transcriptional regulator
VKRLRFENGGLDAADSAILEVLAADVRISLAELARRVGLSAPSVSERVKRLEEAGVIEAYTLVIEPAALGLPIAAWLRVKPLPGQVRKVAELLAGLPEIVECDRITGEDCYIARAYLRSVADLEKLIDRIIPYASTNTSIIQSSPVKRRLPAFTRPSAAAKTAISKTPASKKAALRTGVSTVAGKKAAKR